MIAPLLLFVAVSSPVDLASAMNRVEICVFAKIEEFASAKEAADVTVNAAMAACLGERADFRTATKRFIESVDPSLSTTSRKEVEQSSYDLGINSVRDRALVRLISTRARDATNQ